MLVTAINTEIPHSPIPPCRCPKCLAATALADQRRAELEAMFSRLDDAERLSGEARE